MNRKQKALDIAAYYVDPDRNEKVCMHLAEDIEKCAAEEASEMENALTQAVELLSAAKDQVSGPVAKQIEEFISPYK